MKTDIAFWDTSAALPLCCSENFTTQSRKWLHEYPKMVIWRGTSVEIHSGLARRKRAGDLTAEQVAKALLLWKMFYKSSRIIETVEKVVKLADDLPENYSYVDNPSRPLLKCLSPTI